MKVSLHAWSVLTLTSLVWLAIIPTFGLVQWWLKAQGCCKVLAKIDQATELGPYWLGIGLKMGSLKPKYLKNTHSNPFLVG